MFLRNPSLSARSWIALLASLFLLGATALQAQDEFSIPGVDDPASVSSSSGSSSSSDGEGGEVPQYNNMLEKLIKQGGFAIWPLLALSLVVVGLTVYCFIDLTKGRFYPDKVVNMLQEDMEHGDLLGAKDRSGKSNTCLGQVMHAATEYIEDRGYQTLDDPALVDAMADVSQEFNRGRARTINYFSIIYQAAPMIGLLGTVSGMIKAFDKLGQKGMGDPASLAANISEALLTTATGLVIAVPAVFLYFFFRDRLTQLIARTDRNAYRLLNVLRRTIVAQAAGTPPPQSAPQPEVPPEDPPPQPYVPTPHTPST